MSSEKLEKNFQGLYPSRRENCSKSLISGTNLKDKEDFKFPE
jgi:hypothetical protein